MRTGLYFILKYFSFACTLHLAHGDIRLEPQNLFDSYGDVITVFDSM